MLNLEIIKGISPIFLSVLLLLYLGIYELGNARIKKIFLPFIILLVIVFAIIAFQDIYSIYMRK